MQTPAGVVRNCKDAGRITSGFTLASEAQCRDILGLAFQRSSVHLARIESVIACISASPPPVVKDQNWFFLSFLTMRVSLSDSHISVRTSIFPILVRVGSRFNEAADASSTAS